MELPRFQPMASKSTLKYCTVHPIWFFWNFTLRLVEPMWICWQWVSQMFEHMITWFNHSIECAFYVTRLQCPACWRQRHGLVIECNHVMLKQILDLTVMLTVCELARNAKDNTMTYTCDLTAQSPMWPLYWTLWSHNSPIEFNLWTKLDTELTVNS